MVSVSPGGGAIKIPGAAAAKSAAEADRIALKADSAPQRCLAGFRVMRAKLERTVPRQANAGHGTSRHYSGEAHFAGGRQHGSSNYHLLLEGAKEFQSLADACWRDLQKHAATLLADAPRAEPETGERPAVRPRPRGCACSVHLCWDCDTVHRAAAIGLCCCGCAL